MFTELYKFRFDDSEDDDYYEFFIPTSNWSTKALNFLEKMNSLPSNVHSPLPKKLKYISQNHKLSKTHKKFFINQNNQFIENDANLW